MPWQSDQEIREETLVKIGAGLIVSLILSVAIWASGRHFNRFMAECQQDRPRYECEVLYRAMYPPSQTVNVYHKDWPMAPKDYRRFGSPFDPKFLGSGKIERPKETPKLRGCGDPSCATCNPETAAAAGAPPMTASQAARRDRLTAGYGGFISNPAANGVMADLIRARMEEMSRALGGVDFSMRVDGLSGTPAEKAQPPAAYRRAREAVEKWIVPAPEQSFVDIIGNDDALAGLKDAIMAPVIHKELYEAYGLTMPKGALLSGPPGCGKTMFAKAAASEMKKLYGSTSEFISISGSSIQSPYVGVTEGYIVAIFEFARQYKAYHGHPLLVFIDEADALFPDRTGRVRRVASWEESNVAAFLAEMDGMQASGAFVLLATNRPEALDEAVLRDGRWDFKITVKRPIKEAVQAILSKGFDTLPIRGAEVSELTFAAVEALYDPAYVIHSFGALEVSDGKQVRRLNGKDFALEHVLSGAMASSIPGRASRKAFARDKALGTRSGVNVSDVLAAVKDVFEENKGLEHAFALREFLETYAEEVKAEAESTKKKGMNWMRIAARESVSVELDGVKFVVTFSENDKPLAVKERRMHAPGTFYSAWYNAPRWHHSHGPLSPRSKLYPVLEEARKKLHDRRHVGS